MILQLNLSQREGRVIDGLLQFEESLLAHQIQNSDEPEAAAAEEGDSDGADFLLKDDGNDIELRWARMPCLCLHLRLVQLPLCSLGCCSLSERITLRNSRQAPGVSVRPRFPTRV